MYLGGDIFSLDLGRLTGIAVGPPGNPISYSVELKLSSEPQDVAFSNLMAFLQRTWAARKPGLVFKESALSLAAFDDLDSAQNTVRFHDGLHAIVEGMCVRFGIPWDERADSTIRKHFIGVGRLGSRKETKAAVVAECHRLKLMPKTCNDDNRADAIAGHDYASHVIARAVPAELHMHAPQAERQKKRRPAA